MLSSLFHISYIVQATKKFSKKIRVGLTLCLFVKKESQTRVSRIGNGVHYNDYPYKYSNVNYNDVNDNDNDYP